MKRVQDLGTLTEAQIHTHFADRTYLHVVRGRVIRHIKPDDCVKRPIVMLKRFDTLLAFCVKCCELHEVNLIWQPDDPTKPDEPMCGHCCLATRPWTST